MPRNGSGIYEQPFDNVESDTTIASAVYNGFTRDVEQDLNDQRPIIAGGTGAASADEALVNLSGEKATQLVTNYDMHVWQPGSFRSAVAATGAPNGTSAFAGIAYINEALANPPTNNNVIIEARDLDDTDTPGALHVREKKAGVWGAWAVEGSGALNGKVSKSGDTMTGNLTISKILPNLILNRTDALTDSINLQKGGLNRWAIQGGINAETGSGNVGSDFHIYRFDDAGTALGGGPVLDINRATGATTLTGAFNVTGATTLTGLVTTTNSVHLTSSDPTIAMNKTAAANVSQIYASTGVGAGNARWLLRLSDADEHFKIWRSADGSNFLRAMQIDRGTGAAIFDGALSAASVGTNSIQSNGTIQTGTGIGTGRLNIGADIGSGSATAQMVYFTGGVTSHGIAMRENSGNGSYYQTFYNQALSLIGYIVQSGPSAISFTNASDERLKENHKAVREVLDIKSAIMGVEVLEYAWKGHSHREVGMIAQQVHKFMPRMAHPGNGKKPGDKDFIPWGISYGDASPYLIAASQDHYTALEELTARVRSQQETIDALVARLEALEAK